jgi:hypothetical protein
MFCSIDVDAGGFCNFYMKSLLHTLMRLFLCVVRVQGGFEQIHSE